MPYPTIIMSNVFFSSIYSSFSSFLFLSRASFLHLAFPFPWEGWIFFRVRLLSPLMSLFSHWRQRPKTKRNEVQNMGRKKYHKFTPNPTPFNERLCGWWEHFFFVQFGCHAFLMDLPVVEWESKFGDSEGILSVFCGMDRRGLRFYSFLFYCLR